MQISFDRGHLFLLQMAHTKELPIVLSGKTQNLSKYSNWVVRIRGGRKAERFMSYDGVLKKSPSVLKP